jgi:hypothetical protein
MVRGCRYGTSPFVLINRQKHGGHRMVKRGKFHRFSCAFSPKNDCTIWTIPWHDNDGQRYIGTWYILRRKTVRIDRSARCYEKCVRNLGLTIGASGRLILVYMCHTLETQLGATIRATSFGFKVMEKLACWFWLAETAVGKSSLI